MVLESIAMRKTRNPKIDVEDDSDVVYKDVVIVGEHSYSLMNIIGRATIEFGVDVLIN